jgi:GNAT superfamily N-acetyltransferase
VQTSGTVTAAPPPDARIARPQEWRRIGAVLGQAFQDDPVWRWVCPDAERRRRHLGAAFAHAIRKHVGEGWGWTIGAVDGPVLGGAVWAAPGEWRTRPLDAARVALPMLRAMGMHGIRERVGALSRIEAHHPSDPHWYLEILGADPTMRGRGIGTALLQPVVQRCDTEGIPAYLESSKPENLPFYGRFGFEVTEQFEIGDGAPPMWGMWRDPR